MSKYTYDNPFTGANVDLTNATVNGDVLTADGDGTYSFQPGGGGGGGTVDSVVAGTNITVDATDPANPIVSASGALGVASVTAGNANITIGGTGANPTVAVTGGTFDASGAAAAAQAASQPLDADLTTIAGLTPTTNNVIQSVAGAWASRTPAQLGATLASQFDAAGAAAAAQAASQPADSDLTTIAGLTPTTGNVIQSVAGAWASQTPAQVKTSLVLVKADVGLSAVTNDAQIPLATVTTAGDLIVATGNAAVTRLAAVAANSTLQSAGTGTAPVFRANQRNTVFALTDGATPALDASLARIFTLAAAGDRTIAVPTNAIDGLPIIIAHTASGGTRTLALNTGTNGFAFGSDITALTTTASGKTDYIGCVWNGTIAKWLVLSYIKGF